MIEPIEKKHLFHFLPGTTTLSLGVAGCNLHCDFCINWRISQIALPDALQTVSPAEIVHQALQSETQSIAFTYTEPTVFFEYARDITQLAHEANISVTAKSNGYMSQKALEDMSTWLDAINVDLRSLTGTPHSKIVGAELGPILDNLKAIRSLGLWLEITTLVVPSFNDGPDQLEAIAQFIATELGEDTPWHLLRFYPAYKMSDRHPTAPRSLRLAVDIGKSIGLRYVYSKDLNQDVFSNTFCPRCNSLVIERKGMYLMRNILMDTCCPNCGYSLSGVWKNTPKAQLRLKRTNS